ncbi:gamma-glutamylcyclotransferase [Natrialbaceae archaeon A-arb3/5]
MYVFVYGTLTDPEQVEAVLETDQAVFGGTATLEGFHRVDGRYPTLAPGGRTAGRLLSVDEDELARLDRYEGVERGLYVRVSVPRASGDETAEVYVGDPTRLGVDDRHEWPDGSSVRERVRRAIDSRSAVIRRHE